MSANEDPVRWKRTGVCCMECVVHELNKDEETATIIRTGFWWPRNAKVQGIQLACAPACTEYKGSPTISVVVLVRATKWDRRIAWLRVCTAALQADAIFGHKRHKRSSDAWVETRKQKLLSGEKLLHTVALFGGLEACRAVFSNDREPDVFALSELAQLLFANKDKGANHTQAVVGDLVVCLHCAQIAVVKKGHHEAFSEVVQMLAECQDIVTLAASCRVQNTAFHARAKAANRGQVVNFRRCIQNLLLNVKVWETQSGKVLLERTGVVRGSSRVDSGHANLKVDALVTGCVLILTQAVDKRQRVLAARHADKNAITVLDHVKLFDGRNHGLVHCLGWRMESHCVCRLLFRGGNFNIPIFWQAEGCF
eukprot:m.54946 g.54946  ORF g.54946 m.54946 type:complete len:367 (-) comp6883_c0_seq1:2158-3258(-)